VAKIRERGGAKMKAIVDQDTCTGCELCIETCPEVFEMQNDTAVAKVDVVPPEAEAPEAEETCREAAEDCPVEAITIEE
jgi:ferredoxin